MKRPLRLVRSVRGRITLISTALVAVTLVLASMILMQLVQADLLASAEETLDLALEAQAEQFDLDSEAFISEDSFDLIEADIDGSAIEIGLFTASGEGLAFGELYVDDEFAAGLVIDIETGEIVEILDPTFGQPLADAELAEEVESLAFEVFELADSDGDGARFLVGATPLKEIEESILAIRDALLVIVPSLVVAFALLTWWLVGRSLRPVVSIADQVEAISTSSLDQRVPVPDTDDEVAELATVMNHMLDRLERGGDRQRQFSADASHELRSPLSTVRIAAEMLGRNSPDQRSKRLADDIVAESIRMDELISDLLELSRLDEDRRARELEQVDLADLVRTELARDLADGQITLESPPMVAAQGSPRQLRRLVRNLVDNAKRHADGLVAVSLGAAPDGTGLRLTVDDDGAGIPAAERQTIFERFSRLDEARSRDAGGSGLGLPLVRAVVENHGGTVAVEDSAHGGARFVVSLPADP